MLGFVLFVLFFYFVVLWTANAEPAVFGYSVSCIKKWSSNCCIPCLHCLHLHTTPHHNTTQRNTTQHDTTQDQHNTPHTTTQNNTTQHNTTQHNTTQHNTTQPQHKLPVFLCCHLLFGGALLRLQMATGRLGCVVLRYVQVFTLRVHWGTQ